MAQTLSRIRATIHSPVVAVCLKGTLGARSVSLQLLHDVSVGCRRVVALLLGRLLDHLFLLLRLGDAERPIEVLLHPFGAINAIFIAGDFEERLRRHILIGGHLHELFNPVVD